MSLPLHDLGSIKVSERAHSFLKAKSLQKRMDVAALVRDLVETYVEGEIHTLSLADEIHNSKGFGKITGESK